MNDESMPSDRDATPGVQVNAGDSFYIPAGGLQIWNNEDGTLGFGLTVAVDPWLPDLSGDRGTPLDVMDSILGGGFPVGNYIVDLTDLLPVPRDKLEARPGACTRGRAPVRAGSLGCT